MKKLLLAILKSKIGKAVLGLLLKRLLDRLLERAYAVHGPEGVYISQWLLKLEPEFINILIGDQDPVEVHQTLHHLENDPDNVAELKDIQKTDGLLKSIFG